MKKVLLLLHDQDDAKALQSALDVLADSRTEMLWMLLSPALSVDQKEVAASYDKELAALDREVAAAVNRKDFDAAKKFNDQIEAKKVDRTTELRNAWKRVSPEDRSKALLGLVKPPLEALREQLLGIGIKIAIKCTEHPDHYDRERWCEMLQSLNGAWQKGFPHGDYVVAWPSALAVPAAAPVPAPKAVPVPKQPKPAAQKLVAPGSREEELRGMKHFGFISVARKHGVWKKDAPKNEMIAAILEKEGHAVAAH